MSYRLFVLAVFVACLVADATGADEGIGKPTFPLQPNDVLWFAGDSTTVEGNWATGYVSLVRQAVTEQLPDMKILVAGRGGSGSYSGDLRSGIIPPILKTHPKPTAVIINFGLNDSKSGKAGLKAFVENMRACVEMCRKENVRVGLCTPTTWNGPAQTAPFAEAVRGLAKELNLPVVDLYAAHTEHLKTNQKDGKAMPGTELTRDGVHLTSLGNRLSAATLLPAMGLKAEWKEYVLQPSVTGKGTIVIEPAKRAYAPGEKITIKAVPAEGFRFKEWRDDVRGSETQQTLTVTRHLHLHAVMEPTPKP